MAESAYIPGMCNINTAEVAYRRKGMWFGIVSSVVVFVPLLILDAAWWLVAVALFVPVYIGAIGFLQVKNKFCVGYGASGQQNADEGGESSQSVIDKAAIAADKAKTRKMNLQALVATLLIVAACSTVSLLV